MEERIKYILMGIIIGTIIGIVIFYLLMMFRIVRPFGFGDFPGPSQRNINITDNYQ